jgi:hypothetical protein
MCRNIKTLFNFDPPATDEEIRNASLQYIHKISGSHHPSKMNEKAFEEAVTQVSSATRELLNSLVSNAKPRDRELEAEKARIRSQKRFGK